MNSIIQWNCRGFKANFEELSLLVNEKKPVAICLQETFVKDNDSLSLKYHSCYHKTSDASARACGGVAIVVNNSVPHSLVSLTTRICRQLW